MDPETQHILFNIKILSNDLYNQRPELVTFSKIMERFRRDQAVPLPIRQNVYVKEREVENNLIPAPNNGEFGAFLDGIVVQYNMSDLDKIALFQGMIRSMEYLNVHPPVHYPANGPPPPPVPLLRTFQQGGRKLRRTKKVKAKMGAKTRARRGGKTRNN